MFIIQCEKCGTKQRWGAGVKLGVDTEIEIAGKSIFCGCGAIVEEADGELFEFMNDDSTGVQ